MYFDRHFSLPTGYRWLISGVIDFLSTLDSYAPKQGARLLDIGCGQKPYKKLFKVYDYIGMDFYTEVSNPDVIGSILDIPMESSSMDACLTVWVMDDLEEPEDGVKEIARVLTRGGHWFAVENQSTNQHFPGHDYFRFTPAALKHLCGKHGLELVCCKSYGGDFALIGMALVGVATRVLGSLRLHRLLGWAVFLMINVVCKPLDRFLRVPFFRGKFETNSFGYCYVFRKI